MTKKVEYILDTPVDQLKMSDIERDMSWYFDHHQKMVLASINPQIILMSEKNRCVKSFIEHATHRFADGIGVVKMSKWTKGSIKERVAGIDVMASVLEFCAANKKSIFLYGAKPSVVAQAARNIQLDYPGVIVAGWLDGYQKKSSGEVIDMINKTHSDVLFVALGSPKQEEWLQRYMPQLNATVFQTVGGSFDVYSGTVKRAPEVFIKTNLEWLYRSVSNPKRLNRIFQVPLFVTKGLVWHLKQSKQ
ncbi:MULTISPECIES: WecB/TagA/CpsF family glycosyltransferase [Enterococcaceae]|uniref:WecB/TagA/CpsF family glycosyltransferase n=1 Tax=Enterococcaceae TaxID=81852 RepID=UPI000E507877|nr:MULTISPECIES: WecB/TagA/CpsF family glycosyltransferase [Enterococcaceae]MCI0130528.1 WecB/TagA/CpsF family glycosyltransferase [Vagococcus sp. CY53-2]RGI32250.1 glycosyltransferase [Melissococcus sp. OM08-11BH]